MFAASYPLIETLDPHPASPRGGGEHFVVVHGVPARVSFCSVTAAHCPVERFTPVATPVARVVEAHPTGSAFASRSVVLPDVWKCPVGLSCCSDGLQCAIITQTGHVALVHRPSDDDESILQSIEATSTTDSYCTLIAENLSLRGSAISWSPLDPTSLLYGYGVWLGQCSDGSTLYLRDVEAESSRPLEITSATVTSLAFSPHHASQFVVCTPHDFIQVGDVRSPLASQTTFTGKDRGAIYHATYHPFLDHYLATCTPPRERSRPCTAASGLASSPVHTLGPGSSRQTASTVYVWDLRQPSLPVRQASVWGAASVAALRWSLERTGHRSTPVLYVATQEAECLTMLTLSDLPEQGEHCILPLGEEWAAAGGGYESTLCSDSDSNRSGAGAGSSSRRSYPPSRTTSMRGRGDGCSYRYSGSVPNRYLEVARSGVDAGVGSSIRMDRIRSLCVSAVYPGTVWAVVSDAGTLLPLSMPLHPQRVVWSAAGAACERSGANQAAPSRALHVARGTIVGYTVPCSAGVDVSATFVNRIHEGFLLQPAINGEILRREGKVEAAMLFHWIDVMHRVATSDASCTLPPSYLDRARVCGGASHPSIVECVDLLTASEHKGSSSHRRGTIRTHPPWDAVDLGAYDEEYAIQLFKVLCGWWDEEEDDHAVVPPASVPGQAATQRILGRAGGGRTTSVLPDLVSRCYAARGEFLWPTSFLCEQELLERDVFLCVVRGRVARAKKLLRRGPLPLLSPAAPPASGCAPSSVRSMYMLLSVLIDRMGTSATNLEAEEYARDRASPAEEEKNTFDADGEGGDDALAHALPRYLAAVVHVLNVRSLMRFIKQQHNRKGTQPTQHQLDAVLGPLHGILPLYDLVGFSVAWARDPPLSTGKGSIVPALLTSLLSWVSSTYERTGHPLLSIPLVGFASDASLVEHNKECPLQLYVEMTGDVQLASAVGVYFAKEIRERWDRWRGAYRTWCNQSGRYMHRCEWDLAAHAIQRRYDPEVHRQDHAARKPRTALRCLGCNQQLDNHGAPSSPGELPGGIERGQGGSLATPPLLRALCPNPLCRRPLPRCSICLEPMNSDVRRWPTLEGTAGTTDDAEGPSSCHWFVWCTLCHHGGHKAHMQDWFAENLTCAVDLCDCRCLHV